MEKHFDIFISYKRKSLPTANNLYYRLTIRGYSTFFDLEEMGRDNFNTQLLNYIENAKDVFVILEEGSLDACTKDDWKNDWFCREVAYALEKKKNIIPVLIGGYQMPPESFFPDELKEFPLKEAPEFSFAFFEAYLDKLVKNRFLLSEPGLSDEALSVFKFYSSEDCSVFKEGTLKLVCSLDGMADEPFYLPVQRKGDYRFICVNSVTSEKRTLKEHIDADEEKEIDIQWGDHRPLGHARSRVSGPCFPVRLGETCFDMVRVEGGQMTVGATPEQGDEAESNERPAHSIHLPTYYIGRCPVTQNIWELVMGYNKSSFKDKEKDLQERYEQEAKKALAFLSEKGFSDFGSSSNDPREGFLRDVQFLRNRLAHSYDYLKDYLTNSECCKFAHTITRYHDFASRDRFHYPVENVSFDDAKEFIRRLSLMTNLQFSLPTEEEWEYAARGGVESRGFKYAGSNDLDQVAWYRNNADKTTHPVGEKAPNELGLFDMCGNVWEWTETPAHSYASDIIPGGTVYIRRGGSWWHKAENCRVSRRYPSDHTKKTSGLGLRVVIRMEG